MEEKCDVWHALIALNRSVTPRMLDILTRTRRLIQTGTSDRLSEAEFILDTNIQNAELRAGWKGDQPFLLGLIGLYRKNRLSVLNLPKWLIDQLFRNYEEVFPTWKRIHPHCYVHFDFDGNDLDVYLPEASLYEDMCFAYNQAVDCKGSDTKSGVKAHAFYMRSAIISAFNFVESFLNGLAFDFVTTCRRTLPVDDRDLLTEWDSKRKRQRYLKFRDKVVQYPKIMLNRKTPPFTESNCPAFQTLMENIRFRDAVVHSSPKVVDGGVEKISNLIGIQFSNATDVVDAAIELVKLVDDEVNKGKYDNTWLIIRATDGKFPPDAFV